MTNLEYFRRRQSLFQSKGWSSRNYDKVIAYLEVNRDLIKECKR